MNVSNLIAAIVVMLVPTLAAAQVTVEAFERNLPGGTARGFVATVQLTHPGLEVFVTEQPNDGSGNEALLTRTDSWASANDADLAINANFFGLAGGGYADIVGLSVSDGTIVSQPRVFNGIPDPAMTINNDGIATIGNIGASSLANVQAAIAGVGESSTDSDPGTLLVLNGNNLGATARVQPAARNPRTAVGVSDDGETLYIAVVDGRQPAWSVGMTLTELGQLMIDQGADDAINLDGGGSSSFIYKQPDGDVIENRPSDGQHREVANHLGFRVENQAPVMDPGARRIRGVWLRPPASFAALEAQLPILAAAGVQDLFLETLYWGLATNSSQVFQPRFGFDYLQQAIDASAEHGIRVHAWLETGYLGFGSNADYIFNANPDWLVTDVMGTVPNGDIGGQKFVTLGNPAVQQMFADYVTELAAYPGLEGIHIDYHRYPLDNNSSDAFPAPYSYDLYSIVQFQNQFGSNPLLSATRPGDPLWNEWVQFQRDGISECANVMHQAINAVEPGLQFSAAIFATATTSSSQLTKMQDWPAWAANDFIEVIVPMAYGLSTGSIRSDIQTTNALSSGKRVVAGLAITGTSPHPPLSQQLPTIAQDGIEEFVVFDGNAVVSDNAEQMGIRNWLSGVETLDADFDQNHYVDARDFDLFGSVYTGTPVNATGRNRAYDLDNDGVIDAADEGMFWNVFSRFRFGDDGVVNQRDIDAFERALTGPGDGSPAGDILNTYDLDGDNDVDYDDQLILHTLLTEHVAPDLDVSGDGSVSLNDLYRQSTNPIDVNRDGVIDASDSDELEAFLRAGEQADMEAGRR